MSFRSPYRSSWRRFAGRRRFGLACKTWKGIRYYIQRAGRTQHEAAGYFDGKNIRFDKSNAVYWLKNLGMEMDRSLKPAVGSRASRVHCVGCWGVM